MGRNTRHHREAHAIRGQQIGSIREVRVREGRPWRLGVVAAALVAAVLTFPAAVPAVQTTTNVGLAAQGFLDAKLDGDRAALLVNESAQGGLDRNGDGDADDDVLAVYNAATNTTANVGLAVGSFSDFRLDGDRVAFAVWESAQGGLDRNGDGDADDFVPAVYNAATNTTANVGLAINLASASDLELDGDRVSFRVSESAQGGLDRNGDGDTSDSVLAVYNAATNTTANVGLSAFDSQRDGDRIAFRVYELVQGGLDRNGDGDANDFVLAVYDAATNTTANVGLAVLDFGDEPQVDGNRVALLVNESAQGGLDRNGDSDANDSVLAVYNAATNTTANVGLAARLPKLDGDRAAFAVLEFAQGGLDRNGDGDTNDSVLAIYNAATNTTANVGLALTSLQLEGDRIAFTVPEANQGGLDRNSDGDANDSVLAVYDAATNTTANVGLAIELSSSPDLQLDGGRVAFLVDEPAQGGLDRNGDGDTNDAVFAVYNAVTNTTANLGLAPDHSSFVEFRLDGDRLAFLVNEFAQGGLDRNGDGDASDRVPAVYNAATNTTANVGLASFGLRLNGDRIAFFVAESGQGGIDLNDDGDVGDLVLHLSSDIPDGTAPTTTITLAPATPDGQNGWYTSPVTVTVAATDGAGGSGVAETRCVLDPASAPATFDDIPAGCAYTGAGADVTTNGIHAVYAASADNTGNEETPVSASLKIDQTDPTVTCDVASPGPVFLLMGSGGNVTATVTDTPSGPAQESESAGANVATVGNKIASLTGEDNAGNSSTVSCPYRVSYRFLGFQGLKSSYKRGATIQVKFTLARANGTHISDAEAQALLNPCRVKVTFDGVEQTGCATYSAPTDTFQYRLQTSRSLPLGSHALAIKVSALDGSGVVNTDGTTIMITR